MTRDRAEERRQAKRDLAKADAKEDRRRQNARDLAKVTRLSEDRKRERSLALDRAADKRDRRSR